MKFNVLYGKSWESGAKQEFVQVREIEALDMDQAFMKMQAEIWSPNGEARSLIKKLGLQHTSMSVGDVLQDEKGEYHLVQMFGFKKIKSLPDKVIRV